MEEFIDRNRDKIKILAGFIMVFVLGFSSGYYYLEGNKSSEVMIIKESSDSCAAFFKSDDTREISEGADETAKMEKNAAESTSGVVAGISDSNVSVKAFAGSKNSTIYHTRDCQYVKRIKAENLVWFGSQREAEATGRKPHSCAGKK